MILQPFRLEKNLVRFLVGEPFDLILDRRAVTRPLAGDLATIDGRQVDRRGNDPMRFGGGAGDGAFDLRNGDPVCHGRERHRRVIRRLPIKPVPVDAAPIKARRCAGLQPANRQIERAESR